MESSGLASHGLKYDDEDKGEAALPETPKEPMEFLSRSWSLSANEISKALNQTFTPQYHSGKVRGRRITGRLFDIDSSSSSSSTKKDKARMENAHTHSVVSIAGVAAGLAAASSTSSNSKLSRAVASATQLLASYCIELAESAGADKETLHSVVRSALAIPNATHLLTLTANAATALRGEAAIRARLPKRSASISPGSHFPPAFPTEVEEDDLPCVGDLLQLTQKGTLRKKHVSVYISKTCQVTIKVKSKHVGGGAFSRNNKCIVYEVINESSSWPFRKERENMEMYFAVKSAQGLLEFKCNNKIHKHKWVHGIQNLLQRTTRFLECQ